MKHSNCYFSQKFKCLSMILLLFLAIGLSLALGAKPLSFNKLCLYFFHNDPQNYYNLIIDMRVKRTILALIAGAAFGLAGTLTQTLLRNPIADPGLLGINAGSSTAIILCSFLPTPLIITPFWAAFIGANIATFFLYFLCMPKKNTSPLWMILAGAAMNACLFSISQTLILTYPQALEHYRLWNLGALNINSFDHLPYLLPYLFCAIFLAFFLSKTLNLMMFDDQIITTLGAHLARTRFFCLIAITTLTACATCLAGPISFIGLLAPHLMRYLMRCNFRWLILYSMLAGALILLIADILSRLLMPPQEIALGILTAVIGAPLLYWLATKPNFKTPIH